MIGCLALVAVLGAAPPQVVIVKRSSTGVLETTNTAVLHAVGVALANEQLPSHVVALTCAGDRPCLAAQARTEAVAAVVAVSLLRGRRELSVDLEAVDATGQQLAVQTFAVPLEGEPFPEEAQAFFKTVAHKLLPAPAEDAPRAVTLVPEPAAPRVELRAASHDRPALKAAGITAAALGVASVAILVTGMVVKGGLDSQLTSGPVVQGITRQDALGQASLANGLLTASLVGFGLTAAAVGTAGVFWLKGEPGGESDE